VEFASLLMFVAWLGVVTMRIAVAFFVLPLFSPALMTGSARAMIVLVLAILPVGVVPLEDFSANPPATIGAMLVREAVVGLLLGVLLSLPFWVVQNVGALIDLVTGTSNASVFDPMSGHEGGPLANTLHHLFIALFLATGGFTLIADALYDSYRVWPLGAPVPDFDAVARTFWLKTTDGLFSASLKLAAPVVVALLVVDVALGLVNRVAPSFNVFEMSPAIKGGVALLMLYLVFAFFAEQLLAHVRQVSALPSLHEAIGR
jgi:type III secretion protein T